MYPRSSSDSVIFLVFRVFFTSFFSGRLLACVASLCFAALLLSGSDVLRDRLQMLGFASSAFCAFALSPLACFVRDPFFRGDPQCVDALDCFEPRLRFSVLLFVLAVLMAVSCFSAF